MFGERAEVDASDLPTVSSRFVVAQGGPGDELRLAATYERTPYPLDSTVGHL